MNDVQQEVLIAFQNLTGIEEVELCLRYLVEQDWDLDAAVATALHEKMNGGSSAPTPSSSSSTTSTVSNAAVAPQPARGWIGWGWSIVAGVWRFGWGFVGSLVPTGIIYGQQQQQQRIDDLDPVAQASKLQREFETEYGPRHPTFFQGSYTQALDQAKRSLKFLLVYLHSPQHENTPGFCRTTLCSDVITDFFNDHFIFWAGSVSASEGYKVNNVLGASTYPFMALICYLEDRATVVDKIEGPMATEELLARLATVMEHYGTFLAAARAEREERNLNRRIRQEQDEAFLASLAADQEKERKAKEEQQRRQQELEDEQRIQNEKQQRLQEKLRERQRKEQSLAQEPEDNDKATKILIRLPNGNRLERRFLLADQLQTVYDFVDTKIEHSSADEEDLYDLVTNYPRKVYSDHNISLRDAGLYPQAMLFIQPR